MKNYIADGYTCDAYIAENGRLHSSVKFSYRPLRYEERSIVTDGITNKTPRESARLVFATVARQVTAWDITADDGKDVEITPDNVSKLQPMLIDRIYNIVAGYSSGDIEKNDAAAMNSAADNDLQSLFEGRVPGDMQTESDLKN